MLKYHVVREIASLSVSCLALSCPLSDRVPCTDAMQSLHPVRGAVRQNGLVRHTPASLKSSKEILSRQPKLIQVPQLITETLTFTPKKQNRVVKIINFRGGLSNTSAETAILATGLSEVPRCICTID